MEKGKTKKQEALPEGVTKEMMDAWKEKYGVLKIIEFERYENDEAPLVVVAKLPDRLTVSNYWTWVDKNIKKAGEILINGCLLTNKEQVLADDEYFNTAAMNLNQLIPLGRAKIKNY